MTKRQSEAYRFIAGFIQEHGFSPSYDEIGAALGMKSKESVYRIVRALAAHGKITYLPHRARSIELARQPDTARTQANQGDENTWPKT